MFEALTAVAMRVTAFWFVKGYSSRCLPLPLLLYPDEGSYI
jgi:hypothetical protein